MAFSLTKEELADLQAKPGDGTTFREVSKFMQQQQDQPQLPPKKDLGGISSISGREKEDIALRKFQEAHPITGLIAKKGVGVGRGVMAFGKGVGAFGTGLAQLGGKVQKLGSPIAEVASTPISLAIRQITTDETFAESMLGIKKGSKRFKERQKEVAEMLQKFEQEQLALPEGAGFGEKALKFAGETAPSFVGGFGAGKVAGQAVQKGLGKFAEKGLGKVVTAGAEGLGFEAGRQVVSGEIAEQPLGQTAKELGVTGLISAAFPVAGGIAKAVGRGAKDVTQFGIQKATGLSPETIRTTFEQGKVFQKLRQAGTKASDIFSEAKTKLQGALSESQGVTKQLQLRRGELREANPTIDFGDTLKNAFEKAGFKIGKEVKTGDPLFFGKSGEALIKGVQKGKKKISITTTAEAKTNLSADRITELRNLVKDFDKPKLSIDEYLNFRARIDDLSQFMKIGKTPLTKTLRAEMNQVARSQNPVLAQIDDQFSAQFKGVQNVLDDLKLTQEITVGEKAGQKVIADDFLNKIRKFSRQEGQKLEELEKFLPNIRQDIKIASAMNDIENAMAQKTGTYVQAGLGLTVAGTASGLDVQQAGLIGLGVLLLNPKIFTKNLSRTASINQSSRLAIKKIATKIQTGKSMTQEETDLFLNSMKKIKFEKSEILQKAKNSAKLMLSSQISQE